MEPNSNLTAVQAEFEGNMQMKYYRDTPMLVFAGQELSSVLSSGGKKAHKPIVSTARGGEYTRYQDIAFEQKKATKQTLEVDYHPHASEEVDVLDEVQSHVNLGADSLEGIQKTLINKVEQRFLREIPNAAHTANGGTAVNVNSSDIVEGLFQEAEGTLGAFDMPMDTASRILAVGPQTVSRMRTYRQARETALGDRVATNGVIGPWRGWTVVQSNNLPWTATLAMATNPTAGDTVTFLNNTITFVSDLNGAAPGSVLRGADAAASRANLIALINGTAGAGTTYVDFGIAGDLMLRNKSSLTATEDSNNIVFNGYGDINVAETFTAAGNVFSNVRQDAAFMAAGAIDLVRQASILQSTDKEKGFARLYKGMEAVGAKMFEDGALMTVRVPLDASVW